MSTLVEQDKSRLAVMDPRKDADFNWQIYVQLYDDLKRFKTEQACYAHWLKNGKRENRVASLKGIYEKFEVLPNTFPVDFDWEAYVQLNPDIRSNVSNKWQAIAHYCQQGMKECRPFKLSKRSPKRAAQSDKHPKEKKAVQVDEFDWEFYVESNPDLHKISSEKGARSHWEKHGKKEGRPASVEAFYRSAGVDSNLLPKDFNAKEYLTLHPSLKDEGIDKDWAVAVHFLKNPSYANGIYSFKSLGMHFEAVNDPKRAIEAFEEATKYAPDDVDIRVRLAKALGAVKDWKRAVSVYRKVYQSEQISDWNLYEVSRELLKLIKTQVETGIENSRAAATAFLASVEKYESGLKKKDARLDKTQWSNFRDNLDLLLEDQMSVSLELASVRQAHKAITSTFNLSDFVAFASHQSPTVSVIIPVYNKIDYTIRCLKSLVRNVSTALKLEVIVVDDCSADETREYLQDIEGLILVENKENMGFIHSCNTGAKAARGEYLYFLNNDTEVLSNAIESLIEVFEIHENVGAVGSKLVYPSGALQEAGGIIWQDSSGWNYGRNENPHDPKYNFVRSVDYCSGASLLVRRETFEKLKGFEKKFAPAYFEDADLCFAFRHQLGMEVMYQPASEIIHYEGISSGTSTSSGIKRYQVVNAEKFKKKWATALKAHPVNEKGYEDAHRAARRFQGNKTILVIDSYVPCYDKESGSRRLFQILKIMKKLGYHVIFLPGDMRATEPYTSELQAMQIEVLYTCDGYGTLPEDQLRERLPLIDIAWVCRPDYMKKYLTLLREKANIKVIYDTIDLHYLRMKRELDLGLASEADEKAMSWVDMQALELKMAMRAEMTLTVTPDEQVLLQQQGIKSVEVVPNIHFPYEGKLPSFKERSGLLFIGGYNHPPNVDAVEWLCHEIMPIVWEEIPDLRVTLLGSNPSKKVKALESKRVSVPGYISDVSKYFLNSRVFVAPLRYGAGMKGKVGQSFEYSLPLVSTDIGIEGMNLTSGKDSISANTVEGFAQAILKLYSDEKLWERISKGGRTVLSQYSPSVVKNVLDGLLN